jgi:broad specificity phosphatase PhoE
MLLYLVRHGRAAAGIEALDPGLDELGREQAELTARALAKVAAVRLVTSPLRRAAETAERIAEGTGLAAEVHEAVGEVFHPSMDPSDRTKLLASLLGGRWNEQPAELRAWRQTFIDGLDGLTRGVGPVIVVSHFIAISVAISLGRDDDRITPAALGNASVTTLEEAEGRFVVRRIGDVSHLDDASITFAAPRPGRAPEG